MGGPNAVTGAIMQCTFGMAPSSLTPLPTSRVTIEGRPAATIDAVVPLANIPPFAMCTSLVNPAVAAATSAALGVLTPMACVPAVVGTWAALAPRTTIGGVPALVGGASCTCAWGGLISMTMPGAVRTVSN